jgi:hypothetical protein
MSEAPLYPAPIMGWRVWHVDDDSSGARLLSWSRSAEWPAGRRMEASCKRLLRLRARDHEAPGSGHVCGLYALRSRERAELLLRDLFAAAPPGCGRRPAALGMVSLWGRVIENVDGWRAQYGYPYELFLFGGGVTLARRLRDSYAIDVSLA